MLDGLRSGAPLRWTLLGPVGLRVGEQAADLGRGKQLCVLAALLTTPGQVVPVGTLVERVWGDRPPRSATPLAPYVTRLRNRLEASVAAQDRPALRHQAGGYRLDCAADGVDSTGPAGWPPRPARPATAAAGHRQRGRWGLVGPVRSDGVTVAQASRKTSTLPWWRTRRTGPVIRVSSMRGLMPGGARS